MKEVNSFFIYRLIGVNQYLYIYNVYIETRIEGCYCSLYLTGRNGGGSDWFKIEVLWAKGWRK